MQKRMGKKWKKAAIKIQALARGFIQRPKYKQALLRKKEEEDLANQLDKMKEKLQEAEDQRKRDIEDAKFQFEQEMEEYKEKLEDQLRAESKKHGESAQQQTLIDESGKIIEYLRKENMKLRQQCESMKRDYKSLKENNSRLMEANASASSSFNQLNEHAKGLNGTNARLIKNVDTYKKQMRNVPLLKMQDKKHHLEHLVPPEEVHKDQQMMIPMTRTQNHRNALCNSSDQLCLLPSSTPR